jgi:hypothetical protein
VGMNSPGRPSKTSPCADVDDMLEEEPYRGFLKEDPCLEHNSHLFQAVESNSLNGNSLLAEDLSHTDGEVVFVFGERGRF